MEHVRRVIALLGAGLILVTTHPASAQPRRQRPRPAQVAQGRAAFEEGRREFDAARYEQALAAFRRAHDLVRTPAILFNLGTCADLLHRDEEALPAFEAYLAERPDAPDRVTVEARVRSIRAAIAERNAPPPEPEPVATPAEAAATVEIGPGPGTGPTDDSPGLTSRWWFWAGL